MPGPSGESCSGCYFLGESDEGPICQRYPPQFRNELSWQDCYPCIDAYDDWCGEFKPLKQPASQETVDELIEASGKAIKVTTVPIPAEIRAAMAKNMRHGS